MHPVSSNLRWMEEKYKIFFFSKRKQYIYIYIIVYPFWLQKIQYTSSTLNLPLLCRTRYKIIILCPAVMPSIWAHQIVLWTVMNEGRHQLCKPGNASMGKVRKHTVIKWLSCDLKTMLLTDKETDLRNPNLIIYTFVGLLAVEQIYIVHNSVPWSCHS